MSYNDGPLTQACGQPSTVAGLACGNYAVNTMQPSWQPSAGGSNVLPGINDVDPAKPYYETTSATSCPPRTCPGPGTPVAGTTPTPVTPTRCSSTTTSRSTTSRTTRRACPGRSHLKDETDVPRRGQGRHAARGVVRQADRRGERAPRLREHRQRRVAPGRPAQDRSSAARDAKDTLVVVTYDEFGGAWDHVAPPGQGRHHAGPAGPVRPRHPDPGAAAVGRVHPLGRGPPAHDTTSILPRSSGATAWRRSTASEDARVNDLAPALRTGGIRHG